MINNIYNIVQKIKKQYIKLKTIKTNINRKGY